MSNCFVPCKSTHWPVIALSLVLSPKSTYCRLASTVNGSLQSTFVVTITLSCLWDLRRCTRSSRCSRRRCDRNGDIQVASFKSVTADTSCTTGLLQQFSCGSEIRYIFHQWQISGQNFMQWEVNIWHMVFNTRPLSTLNAFITCITCVTASAALLQYIPRNKHTVLLCFALLWLCNRS